MMSLQTSNIRGAHPIKPPDNFSRALPVRESDVAIVIGGSEEVLSEFDAASRYCHQAKVTYETFVANDLIEDFPQVDHAVTLHPAKLEAAPHGWLYKRKQAGLLAPREVWVHRWDVAVPSATQLLDQWVPGKTSSGLFAVQAALKVGYDRIICCGVPMLKSAGHKNRKVPWKACYHFLPTWEKFKGEMLGKVTSMSGWTAELLGRPTVAFLMRKEKMSDTGKEASKVEEQISDIEVEVVAGEQKPEAQPQPAVQSQTSLDAKPFEQRFAEFAGPPVNILVRGILAVAIGAPVQIVLINLCGIFGQIISLLCSVGMLNDVLKVRGACREAFNKGLDSIPPQMPQQQQQPSQTMQSILKNGAAGR